jgi:hypothetical protein
VAHEVSGELNGILSRGERALLDDGDLATARPLFEVAARGALAVDDDQTLARAALGLGGLWVHEHRGAIEAARMAAWQRRALSRLDPTSALAARLRVRLAAEADYAAGTSQQILAEVESARGQDDPVVLAEALSLAHHCLLSPQYADQRLALANELLDAAGLTGRPSDEVVGLLWRTVDLLLSGDPHAERSLRDLLATSDRHPLRAVRYVLSAIAVMRAIRRGELAEATGAANACAAEGQEVGDVDALGWYAAHMVTIRWFQGRLRELRPMLDEFAHSPTLAGPDDSMFAALAVAAAASGDQDGAHSALRRLRGQGLGGLRRSSTWLVTMAGVIEAADLLGDAVLAREAYQLLEPYAGRPVMASLAVTCFGSVSHYLGVAALTMGELDLAVRHLHEAVAANETLMHRPAVQASRLRLTEARRRQRGGRVQHPAACWRQGPGWRVTVGSRAVDVEDIVGMRYLAWLISSPGQEVSAADLVGAGVCSPAEPVLDEAARAAYRIRIAELRAELDHADVIGDPDLGRRAQGELEWVEAELGRLTGLGGRARAFADPRELARTSVQKAIRRALARIRTADQSVADEIEHTLVTGTVCCYRPTVPDLRADPD